MNIHKAQVDEVVFQYCYTMNFLTPPLSRTQLFYKLQVLPNEKPKLFIVQTIKVNI